MSDHTWPVLARVARRAPWAARCRAILALPVLLAVTLATAAAPADATAADVEIQRKQALPGTSEGEAAAPVDTRAEADTAHAGAQKKSGREPPDPAEQRPAILPPPRPDERSVLAGGVWISRGPAPTYSAQVNVPPDHEVTGAVQAIAAHPVNPDIIYVGAVNGGVWVSINATAAQPSWTPLTDNLPSQSIGALAMDPLDPARRTVIAGTGRLSNFANRGDDEIGVYYTTNGGANWTVFGAPTLVGQKLLAVAARGLILMAASSNGGLYRSTNGGGSFTLVSGTGNLPSGGVFDLVGDRTNNARFYISVGGSTPKVLRSDDTGATWTDTTSGLTALGASTNNLKLAVGALGVVYLATVNNSQLARVSRSTNFGATWNAMDVPAIHPGSQGGTNLSIAADPANQNLVYLGGDRIVNPPFTGNLVRGNASLALGSQFASIQGTGAGNTAPHADSRALVFDVNGNLLQGDDGGIYRRSSPTSSAGTWASVIGNLSITEVHDLSHDSVSNSIMIGTQDNGTHLQQGSANLRWLHVLDGDGGDVAIDDTTLGAAGSFRYDSAQLLQSFRRTQYNAANAFLAVTLMPTIADPQFVTPIQVNVGSPSRLLIGGLNTIYESTNATTAAPTLTSLGAPGANRNAMAYGANGNTGVAYVGKNAAVFVRSGNAFVATAALPAGANTITDVAINPNDPTRVFAIDDDQVFRSTNSGASWLDVTGNLPTISSFDFRTIEYMPDASGDLVAIGTRSGVYSAAVSSTTWSRFGTALPDVLVFDLRYVQAFRTLIAATLGRGVWSTTHSPNTAPSFTPAAAITRQKGSPATTATVGTVSDPQSPAGNLTVTQISGGTSSGVTAGAITNTGGSISTPIAASCTAAAGTLRFQVSDGSLTGNGDLGVNLTPNTLPTVSYPNSSISQGAGGTINPSSGPADNGSILVISVQSQGTYTGGINVNTTTGVITLTNAAPAGTHLINIQIADNCFEVNNTNFQLTVQATSVFANGFE